MTKISNRKTYLMRANLWKFKVVDCRDDTAADRQLEQQLRAYISNHKQENAQNTLVVM